MNWMEAVRDPKSDGVAVTVTWHVAEVSRYMPEVQVLADRAKFDGFAPTSAAVVVMFSGAGVRVRSASPLLVSVMTCGALSTPMPGSPKLRLVGLSDPPPLIPRPDRVTICGLPAAMPLGTSVNLIDEALFPPADGQKRTF